MTLEAPRVPPLSLFRRYADGLVALGRARLHWEWCGGREHLGAIVAATRHPAVRFVLASCLTPGAAGTAAGGEVEAARAAAAAGGGGDDDGDTPRGPRVAGSQRRQPRRREARRRRGVGRARPGQVCTLKRGGVAGGRG